MQRSKQISPKRNVECVICCDSHTAKNKMSTTKTSLSNNKSKSFTATKQPVKIKILPKVSTVHNSRQSCGVCNSISEKPLQKEIVNGNGTTDRPIKQVISKNTTKSSSDRESWGKMLKQSNETTNYKFYNFDPLRTLHFLATELQRKIVSTDYLYDEHVHQMLEDMLQALSRIPPEVAAVIKTISFKGADNSVSQVHKGCQTISHKEETEIIQRFMEGSTMKLEASCRQMEMLCGQMKTEKEDLEKQLNTEKESVRLLKNKMGDLEVQCEKLVMVTIKGLEEEKNELQEEVDRLTNIVESQSVHSNYEMKAIHGELKKVKSRADQEIKKLKHQLEIANMEREKYVAILEVRNKQIDDIRIEMSNLQDVVNEQLMDIHRNALEGLPSEESLDTDNWMKMETEALVDNAMSIGEKQTSSGPDKLKNSEPSEGKKENAETKPLKGSASYTITKKQSIRNTFDMLKKQALSIYSATASEQTK